VPFRRHFSALLVLVGLLISGGTCLRADDPGWLAPVQRLADWLDASEPNRPFVQTHLELVSKGSRSLGFSNLHAHLTVRVPDRLHLTSGTNRTRVEFGRHGNKLWLWEPALKRWTQSRLPDGADPIGFPVAGTLLGWASKGCETETFKPVAIQGEPSTPYRVRPGPLAKEYLGTADFTLNLWIQGRSQLPLAARWQDPAASTDLTAWLRRVRVSQALNEVHWAERSPGGIRTEDVSLDVLRQRLPRAYLFVALELSALPPPN
jgi:hypothetical protein